MAVGAVGNSGGRGSSASAEELEQRAQEAVDAYCAPVAMELQKASQPVCCFFRRKQSTEISAG